MSQFQPLVLAVNEDETPVEITFAPRSLVNGLATWRAPAASYDAEGQVTMSVTSTTAARVARVRQKVVMPIIDSSSGVDVKVGEVSADTTYTITKAASPESRDAVRCLNASLAHHAVTEAAVKLLEGIF